MRKTIHMTNLCTKKQMDIPYVPFGEIGDEDEFIRLGGYCILLRDIQGERRGDRFFPSEIADFGRGLGHGYEIHKGQK